MLCSELELEYRISGLKTHNYTTVNRLGQESSPRWIGRLTRSPSFFPQWMMNLRALSRSMSSSSWAATTSSVGWLSQCTPSDSPVDGSSASRLVLNSLHPLAMVSCTPTSASHLSHRSSSSGGRRDPSVCSLAT